MISLHDLIRIVICNLTGALIVIAYLKATGAIS